MARWAGGIVAVLWALFQIDGDQLRLVSYLLAENRLLRARLPERLRFTNDERRQLARAAHGIPRASLARVATLATPDTLLRWYRELVARKYTAKRTAGPGRPTVDPDIEAAIVRLAEENRSWVRISRHRGHRDRAIVDTEIAPSWTARSPIVDSEIAWTAGSGGR